MHLRKYAKVVLFLSIGIFIVFSLKSLLIRYKLFTDSLISFRAVKINDRKSDVVYKLGFPDEVLLFPIKSSPVWVYFGKGEIDFAVQSEILSTNTSVYKSQSWTYNNILTDSTVQIEVNQNGLVQKFTLYSYKDENYEWARIAGINHGDPEDALRKLGNPSNFSMLGEEKEIDFKNLGLTFKLRRGKVFGVEKNGFEEEWFNLMFLFIKSCF
jgi:hypothetical protein